MGDVRRDLAFELFGWVIMPEHIHLLIRPDHSKAAVPDLLWRLKKLFSQRVIKRWKKLDAPILNQIRDAQGRLHFWQAGGGYDRNTVTHEEFREKLNYIHNNPVTRGLVESPTDWRWSSAIWYAGRHDETLISVDSTSM